jgi:hypothetical protein
MAAVVAAVVRCGRAFLSAATASVVGDVGGGCDGASRPFSCRAVMIARARIPGRFGAAGPGCQRRTVSPTFNVHDVRGFGSADPPEL